MTGNAVLHVGPMLVTGDLLRLPVWRCRGGLIVKASVASSVRIIHRLRKRMHNIEMIQ